MATKRMRDLMVCCAETPRKEPKEVAVGPQGFDLFLSLEPAELRHRTTDARKISDSSVSNRRFVANLRFDGCA